MGQNFDDLFNEFFKNRKSSLSSINNEIGKIINTLINFKKQQFSEDLITDELGEPTEIIDYTEDGMNFKKLIWRTPIGQFIKIIVTDANSNEEPKDEDDFSKRKKHSKSLEQRLKEAVEVEDYELAIKLRDEIKKNKKSRAKRTKKGE
jgi:excinuclease UvrABC helicase subunit UvrB